MLDRVTHELESDCAPNCASSDVGTMRRDYLVADISLGLAIAAGAALAWYVLAAPRANAAPKAGLVAPLTIAF